MLVEPALEECNAAVLVSIRIGQAPPTGFIWCADPTTPDSVEHSVLIQPNQCAIQCGLDEYRIDCFEWVHLSVYFNPDEGVYLFVYTGWRCKCFFISDS